MHSRSNSPHFQKNSGSAAPFDEPCTVAVIREVDNEGYKRRKRETKTKARQNRTGTQYRKDRKCSRLCMRLRRGTGPGAGRVVLNIRDDQLGRELEALRDCNENDELYARDWIPVKILKNNGEEGAEILVQRDPPRLYDLSSH